MLSAAALAALLPLAAAAAVDAPWLMKDMPIARAGVEHEWPFSVDEGELTCIIFMQRRQVIFTEPDLNDPDAFLKGIPYQMPRSVIVSTNPLEIFASLEDADLFLPFDSDFAVLIRRLAPFVAMGQALCDELLAEQAAGDGAGEGN